MHNINDNVVQGRLSENYLTWKIIAWNILDTKYSRITVHHINWYSVPKEMSYTRKDLYSLTGLLNSCDPPLPVAGKLPVHVKALVARQLPRSIYTHMPV